MKPASTSVGWGRRLFGWLVLALVLASVLMPGACIHWMRRRWEWFAYPLDWIGSVGSFVSLIHLILFLLLGVAIRMALPRWRIGGGALALLVLGVGTELAQIFIPGRHPIVSEMAVNVVAGLVGWGLAHALMRRF